MVATRAHTAQVRSMMLSGIVLVAVASITACSDSQESATTSAPADTTTTFPISPEMAVDQAITRGQEFAVSFTGKLSESRGGYLFVHDLNGEPLALLWDEYLTETPTRYELDPDRWQMLDYGVMGDESSFVFPSELPSGSYVLCTANSADGGCVAVTAT